MRSSPASIVNSSNFLHIGPVFAFSGTSQAPWLRCTHFRRDVHRNRPQPRHGRFRPWQECRLAVAMPVARRRPGVLILCLCFCELLMPRQTCGSFKSNGPSLAAPACYPCRRQPGRTCPCLCRRQGLIRPKPGHEAAKAATARRFRSQRFVVFMGGLFPRWDGVCRSRAVWAARPRKRGREPKSGLGAGQNKETGPEKGSGNRVFRYKASRVKCNYAIEYVCRPWHERQPLSR